MIKILNSSLQLLAVLQNAVSPKITEEINGAFTFTFTTVIDMEKSQYINYQNLVEIENNYFNIVYYKKLRNSDDTTTIEVECEHVSYILNDDDNVLEDGFTAYGTPAQIMAQLFQGTPFTVGIVEIASQNYISINEATNKRAVLMAIPDIFGGEFKFDKYQVSLLQRRGVDRGVQFRYRKNLINCSYIVDNRKKVNGLPTVSVEVAAAELEFANGGMPDEHYKLGDNVTVIDPDLGVNIPSRIVKESHNPLERMQGEVNISNVIEDITDTITEIQKTTVVKDATYNGCKIGPQDGFECIRGDNMVRVLMNATKGYVLQKGDGSGSNWEDLFYVDISGNQHMYNGYIELITSDEKHKILINPSVGIEIQYNTGSSWVTVFKAKTNGYLQLSEGITLGDEDSSNVKTIEFYNTGGSSICQIQLRTDGTFVISNWKDVLMDSSENLSLDAFNNISIHGNDTVSIESDEVEINSPIINIPDIDTMLNGYWDFSDAVVYGAVKTAEGDRLHLNYTSTPSIRLNVFRDGNYVGYIPLSI